MVARFSYSSLAMARTALATTLVIMCSALRFVAEQESPPCTNRKIAYEAFNPAHPNVCSVFCVPEGGCQGLLESGQMTYLGITGVGNCSRKGNKQRLSSGPVASHVAYRLKHMSAPCQGMTAMRFAMGQNYSAEGCRSNQIPYESFNLKFPGVCLVFCVPEGPCEGLAQDGTLNHFGITGHGDCKRKGYTALAPLDKFTNSIEHELNNFQGTCRGMKLLKFQKNNAQLEASSLDNASSKPHGPTGAPPVLNASTNAPSANSNHTKVVLPRHQFNGAPVRMCGSDMIPYEAFYPQYPRMCSVFCVPEGQCEGKVQLGQFFYLGIKTQGNCKTRGYTVSIHDSASTKDSDTLLHFTGPCRGMRMFKFRKPRDNDSPADSPANRSTYGGRQSKKPHDSATSADPPPSQEPLVPD